MKHLKSYNESISDIFKSKNAIRSICRKYSIKNYTINKDGSVDVDANVDLDDFNLTKLPLKFRNVTGYFGCKSNLLSVSNDFYCYSNKIATFEHLPFSIGGDLLCDDNPIFEIWKLFKDYDKIELLNDCDPVRESKSIHKEPIIILDRLNFFLEEIGKKPVTKVRCYKCIK